MSDTSAQKDRWWSYIGSCRRRPRQLKCNGVETVALDVQMWPRHDHKNLSKLFSAFVVASLLLIPSGSLFSTSNAFAPILHHTSLTFQLVVRAASRKCIHSYCAKEEDHDEGRKKRHSQTQLPKNLDGLVQSSDQFRLPLPVVYYEQENEVPEMIPMIRQLTNLSQIHDIVNLIHHQGSVNSTLVTEITQRFAQLLTVRYNNTSADGASNDPHFLEDRTTDGGEEKQVLSVVLNLVTSMFHKDSFRNTQHQFVLDAANCFVGLTNVLQNLMIRHSLNNNQNDTIVPVINQLWDQIAEYEHRVVGNGAGSRSITYIMSPRRLVSFVLAIQKMHKYTFTADAGIQNSSITMYNMNTSSLIYANACTRLCHGDRISRLNLHDIYQTLKSIERLPSSPWNVCNSLVTQQLLISLVRRIRKPVIYNTTSATSTIIQGLDQMRRLWYSINATFSSISNVKYLGSLPIDLPISSVARELELSIFRLLHHVICTDVSNKINHADTITCKQQLSIKELGILAVTIQIVIPRKQLINSNKDNDNETVNQHIPYRSLVMQLQHLMTMHVSVKEFPVSTNSVQGAKFTTIRDISRILGIWEYYQYHDTDQKRMTEDTDSSQSTQHMIQTLGHLMENIVEGTGNVADVIMPTDVNNILRTLAFLPKSYSKQSYHSALGYLLAKNEGFLRRCSITELSNFSWFVAFKSNYYFYNTSVGDAVIVAIGNRIIGPSIYQVCSPKEACRIISAFTALCCDMTNARTSAIEKFGGDMPNTQFLQQDHGTLLSKIFLCLGECLLESSDLSPHDASSAIYAYAKAQYMFDMGIFDHLVNAFATHVDINPSSCTLRQICQTLWACGKMASFESSQNNMDDAVGDITVKAYPPYYNAFVSMLSHVLCNADDLSVQDITQTFLAMSHFNFFVHDAYAEINIEPLLRQALVLSFTFNAHERATLLWSFSRIPSMSPMLAKTIFLLTRPFAQQCDPVQQLEIDHPQVASIILYSLGRMNIRDSDVFHYLTSYVLKYQINTASAQTVANILWAHRTVHIEPPQRLLESWTLLKLPDLKIVKGSDNNWWSYN